MKRFITALFICIGAAALILFRGCENSPALENDNEGASAAAPPKATPIKVPQGSMDAGPRTEPALGQGHQGSYEGKISHLDQVSLNDGSGTIVASLLQGSESSIPFSFSVSQGSWNIEAGPGAVLQIYKVNLDGIQCWPLHPSIELLAGEPNTLILDSKPTLRVLDAETTEHLAEVATLPGESPSAECSLTHTGRLGNFPLPHSQPSPIPAGPNELPNGVFMVTAPGYTWGSGFVGNGRILPPILLSRAGSLSLRMDSSQLRKVGECKLILKNLDSGERRPSYAVHLASQETDMTLRKIRAGRYRASIVSGYRYNHEWELYSSDISIEPGMETELDVRLSILDDDKVDISFVFEGDEASLARIDTLRVLPSRVLSSGAAKETWLKPQDIKQRDPGVIEYNPVSLSPGVYFLDTRPLGLLHRIELTRDSLYHQLIRISPPCQYTLSFRDASGLPAVLQGVNVESYDDIDSVPLSLPPMGGASWVAVEGTITFEAPRGNLRVRAMTSIFERPHTFFLDGKSRSDFTLTLPGYSEVRVRLALGGEPYAAPLSWWIQSYALDNTGAMVQAQLEFETPNQSGWYPEMILKVPSSQDMRLILPPLIDPSPPPIEFEGQFPPGRSALELDVMSGEFSQST